jgi:hypothetical protein
MEENYMVSLCDIYIYNLMLNYILKKFKVTVFRANINAEVPFTLFLCMHHHHHHHQHC